MSCTPTQKESIKSFLKRICNVHDALSYILPCRRHCGSRRGHPGAVHTTHTVCRDQSMRRCVSDPTGRHRCTPAGRPCAGSAADTTPCDSKHQCRVGVGVEFNAPPSTVLVISEVVFTANHLTGTDKQKPPYRKTYKLNTTHIKQTKQNKTTLVQSLLMTLGQKTRWAYFTKLPTTPYNKQEKYTRK